MDNPKVNTLMDLFKNPRFSDFLILYFALIAIIYIVMSILHPAMD